MTAPDLDALKELLAKATPGPWKISLTDDTSIINADRREVCTADGDYNSPDDWPLMEANAALIVAAVNSLPALLSERDALRAGLEHLANASDAVGIQYFDSDDMAAEPAEMQLATIAARALLGAKP